MDEDGQKEKNSNFIDKIEQKNGMNTQETVASVLKIGMICATAGGVIYHVANKFHEKPEIWRPVLCELVFYAGVFGYCAWIANLICKTKIALNEQNRILL
jgi:hypothetical protein